MKAFMHRQLGHFVQLHTSNWYQEPEPECRAMVTTPMFCPLYALLPTSKGTSRVEIILSPLALSG